MQSLLPACAPQGPALSRGPQLGSRVATLRSPVLTRVKQKDGLVPLPLSYYEVLQVPKDASIDDCKSAFDALVNPPKDNGYSTECIYSRAQLLKVAADCLVDSEARSHYNSMLSKGGSEAQVLHGDMPGALALLQEAGHPDLVIKLAKQWLQESSDAQGCADVALTMSQSYCDLANDALEAGRISEGYTYLTSASNILKTYNSGSALAADINGALDGLLEEYLQEQLKPAGDEASARVRTTALHHLRSHLTAPEGPLAIGARDRKAFLLSLRPVLTARDLVDLYSTTREDALPVSERYHAALAHLAEGVRTSTPKLVATALKRFKSLETSDTSVPAAACHLLLGDVDRAIAALHLHPDSALPPDDAVLDYVMSYSEEDALPGVIALTERWLTEDALPCFPEMPTGFAPTMAWWGEQPQVQKYLAQSQGLVATSVDKVTQVFEKLVKSAAMGLAVLANLLHMHKFSQWVQARFGVYTQLDAGSEAVTLQDFAREEQRMFWNLSAMTPAKRMRMLVVTALCAACAAAAILFALRPQSSAPVITSPPAPVAAANVAPKAVSAAEAVYNADIAAIKTTLVAWQEAKQAAMGPDHDIAALDSVLEGNMLAQWRTRANHINKINWHWRYHIDRIQIHKASFIKDDAAKVEVQFQEKADAMFKGEVHDSYKNDYSIEYHLSRHGDAWKISGSRVTQEGVNKVSSN